MVLGAGAMDAVTAVNAFLPQVQMHPQNLDASQGLASLRSPWASWGIPVVAESLV